MSEPLTEAEIVSLRGVLAVGSMLDAGAWHIQILTRLLDEVERLRKMEAERTTLNKLLGGVMDAKLLQEWDQLRARVKEREETVEAFARSLAESQTERHQLRDRVKELEDSCWEAGVRLTELKVLCKQVAEEAHECCLDSRTHLKLERAGRGESPEGTTARRADDATKGAP